MSILKRFRITVNRNFKDLPFPAFLDSEYFDEFDNNINKLIDLLGVNDISYIDMSDLTELEKKALLEEEYINKEMLEHKLAKIIFIDSSTRILVNGEDHISVVCEDCGCDISALFEKTMNIEKLLDENFVFEFHEKYGYLTSNIEKCGSGIYPSAKLHLPVLSLAKELKSLLNGTSKCGVNISISSDNLLNPSDILEFYPNNSLGEKEDYSIKLLITVIREFEKFETELRNQYFENNKEKLVKIINNAASGLLNEPSMDENSMKYFFSKLFLGLELGILKTNDNILNNYDYIEVLDGFSDSHLELEKGRELSVDEKNNLRAYKIREFLEGVL